MGIQKIQRIRWRSRESRRYDGDPEDLKDTTGSQRWATPTPELELTPELTLFYSELERSWS
jgi:hypothetical protein